MKHDWYKDEDGNIDEWAWESGYHNGVICKRCGESFCVHCTPNYDETKCTESEELEI